jgi:putative Holliday junction resolvase
MSPALARYLAVDYGEKRIGLAISDPLGIIASPSGFITRRPGKACADCRNHTAR